MRNRTEVPRTYPKDNAPRLHTALHTRSRAVRVQPAARGVSAGAFAVALMCCARTPQTGCCSAGLSRPCVPLVRLNCGYCGSYKKNLVPPFGTRFVCCLSLLPSADVYHTAIPLLYLGFACFRA